jgi:GLPGLI family protein
MHKYFISILFILLFSRTSIGQLPNITFNIICTYKLDYQTDSNDVKSIKSEDMLLLLNDNYSVFKSKNWYLQDSVLSQVNGLDMTAMGYIQSLKTNFKFTILKDNSDNLHYFDFIDKDKYEYIEAKRCFNWKVLPDTSTINNFHCQKAVTNYGGRKWNCWFTTEIPISEGPYKFNGLPGLIIKADDEQGYFVFNLIGINKTKPVSVIESIKDASKITKDKFYSYLDYFNKNRFALAQQRGVKFISGEDAIKKRLEDQVKKNNNPIEIIIVK